MYYAEKMINGILHWQSDPNGKWIPYTIAELSHRYDALAQRLAEMERELQAIRDTVGDEDFYLRQEIARLREERARLKEKWAVRRANLIEYYEQQLAAAQGVCEWTEGEEGNWDSACGESFIFIDGGPKENRMKWCCYCGQSMTVKPYSEWCRIPEPREA